MTNQYLDRITPFHRGKPKFTQTVDDLTGAQQEVTNFIASIIAAFDLDDAVGVQLDTLGEWIGRNRHVLTPIPRYWLSLGIAERGLGEGEWYRDLPADENVVDLDDETYRLLLRAKIAANAWDGTTEGAVAALRIFFGESALIFIDDTQDMNATFCFAGALPAVLYLILFSRGYLPLKPGGVGTRYRVTSVNGSPIFGLGVQNEYISGLGTGALAIDPETLFS